ncbi:MAG TPA: tetratricopeptide repeat protein [Micropepsaceae bacterium]|jgi:Flp pilus assembly protein TadD
MNRSLLGIILAAGLTSSAAWAAASAPQKPADAESDSQAAQLKPQDMHFLTDADQAAKAGDSDGAVQLYHSAIIYAPGDPVPYERLAEFYVHSNRPEQAQRYFTLALDAQPAYAPALQGLALLDIAAGNRAAAQAQHDILLHSCGAKCPETAQVEKALNSRSAP